MGPGRSNMGNQAGGQPSSNNAPQTPNFTTQPLQRANLGSPERTLYDRYSKLLQNPEGMAQDPAYQFLFNQGMQGLNRQLAAGGKSASGAAMAEATKFGQGTAAGYMNQMLPQYRGGAQEELSRFMGPAGLLPQYLQQNNQAIGAGNAEQGAKALLPEYLRMMNQDSGYPGRVAPGGGASYNGMNTSTNPASPQFQRLAPQPGTDQTGGGFDPSTSYNSQGTFQPYYTGYDAEGGPAYG